MFMGIRWFAEGSTPRRSHPVRSAEKTPAATTRCPCSWELQAPFGHLYPRLVSFLPPPPRRGKPLSFVPAPPLTCSNCCLSTQTRTFCCQQKHTWGRHCHPTRCRQHTPTRSLPLSKPCSHTHSQQTLPAQLSPWPRLPLEHLLVDQASTRCSL